MSNIKSVLILPGKQGLVADPKVDFSCEKPEIKFKKTKQKIKFNLKKPS